MKSKKISILASSTVLLLSVGLVAGCADAEEEENAAAPAIIAPIPSEGATYEPSEGATYEPMVDESTAAIEEESFSIEGLEEYEPIESVSDMLGDATDTVGEAYDNTVDAAGDVYDNTVDATGDAIDSTVDSMLGMVDSGVDATENLVEDAQETTLEVIETIEEPQTQELVPNEDALDVVPATSDIISSVQQSLTNAGFNPGPTDGMSGPRTVAAINDFQNQNNLAGGGQLTKETLRALGVNF